MNKHLITIEADKCIGCSLCAKDCPAGNIRVTDGKAAVKGQNCIKCAHCAAICPNNAIEISGFDEEPVAFAEQTRLNPETLRDALRSRRSIRQFLARQIPDEVIGSIIEAGRQTPTGSNAQNTTYVVLQNEKDSAEEIAVRLFKKLLPFARFVYPAAADIIIDKDFFFKKAPVAVVVVSPDQISASLAASNMALMAEAHGLGVLYSGFFTIAVNNSGKLRKKLGLMRRQKAVTTLVLGYPAVRYKRTAVKEAARIISK